MTLWHSFWLLWPIFATRLFHSQDSWCVCLSVSSSFTLYSMLDMIRTLSNLESSMAMECRMKESRIRSISIWLRGPWSYTWTLPVISLLLFLKTQCGIDWRIVVCSCSFSSLSSFSFGLLRLCCSEYQEHSSSAWYGNHTRNNIDCSLCTTTRSRQDTMKKTSKS